MALPYFPLFPKDLLTDERIAELTTEELGLWLVVLCRMWIAENELIDDDDRISRVLRIPIATWAGLKCRLINNGLLKVDNGVLLNNRLTYEFLRICNKSDQAKRAALVKAQKSAKVSPLPTLQALPALSGKEKLEADLQRMKDKEQQQLTANA
jgi:uncharacterized protein YdaU (DUF1376 family)